MKMQLRTLILVGLHILGIYGAIVKRDAGPDLSGINWIRSQIFTISNIDLPALEWDEGLAKRAKTMPSDCERLRHGSGYRVFPDAPDEDAQKLVDLYYNLLLIAEDASNAPNVADDVKDRAKKFINITNNGLENGHKRIHALGFELLNPNQNKIGCARTKCTLRVSDEIKSFMAQPGMPSTLAISSDKVVFNAICITGPSNKWPLVSLISSAIPKALKEKGGHIGYEMRSLKNTGELRDDELPTFPPTTKAPEPTTEESSPADSYQTLLALSIALFVIFFQ